MGLLQNYIQNKILALVGMAAFLSLAGMVVFYTSHQERSIFLHQHNSIGMLNQSIIKGLTAVMLTGSAEIAQTYANYLKEGKDLSEVQIMRVDGVEAFRDNKTIREVNRRIGEEEFMPRSGERRVVIMEENSPHLRQALESESGISYEESNAAGERFLTYLTPINNGEKCFKCHGKAQKVRGLLKLSTSLASVERDVHETRMQAVRVLIFSLLVLLLLTFLLIRRVVVRPIHRVTRAMMDASQGNLSQKVPVPGKDEIGRMAESFNDMLHQLLNTYMGLQQEQDKLSTIILSAREGIIVTNRDGVVVLVNPAAERILEKTTDELIAGGFEQFMDDPDFVRTYLARAGTGMPDTLVYKNKVVNLYISTIWDDDKRMLGSAALIRDVTEEKKLEAQLREMSFTDALTGLLNRRRLEDVLATEFARSRRYGYTMTLMMFDVDHFKKFNDTHGHDQGDRVLQAIGAAMREHFRKTDFPCRYGGEEFCVIMPSTDMDGAYIAAERFREKVENLVIDGLKVTVSIGLACYPKHGQESGESLMKVADNALYEGKKAGRNRVIMAQ
ncbi:MAG: diguanylate cyclase [Magnetococcales bacterium]|nr:diguanylate cyclase [Magnetococcales bacterium]NGZ29121.1 diguanylate cyclase [Magnetococcales bacterium]